MTDSTLWADKVKRFLAALIDGILAGAVSIIPFVGGIIAAAYILVKDGLPQLENRSLGKKLMKLKVTTTSGEALDMNGSIRRNWPLALGYISSILVGFGLYSLGMTLSFLGIAGLIECILVLVRNQRFGDQFANTIVTEE